MRSYDASASATLLRCVAPIQDLGGSRSGARTHAPRSHSHQHRALKCAYLMHGPHQPGVHCPPCSLMRSRRQDRLPPQPKYAQTTPRWLDHCPHYLQASPAHCHVNLSVFDGLDSQDRRSRRICFEFDTLQHPDSQTKGAQASGTSPIPTAAMCRCLGSVICIVFELSNTRARQTTFGPTVTLREVKTDPTCQVWVWEGPMGPH